MVDLSGLRDIHIPKEPSWWPPALGWWIVFGGIMLALMIGIIMMLSWYNQPRQYALRELKKTYIKDPNTVLLARYISILLKRIVLLLYPRTKVATLSEQEWIDFLSKKTGKTFSESQLNLLAEATYMPEKDLPADNPEELYKAAQRAILKLFGGKHNGRKSKKSS